jgi:trimeric autotransporter adhesin
MNIKLLPLTLAAAFFVNVCGVSAQYISTFAGQGFIAGYAGDNGLAVDATMYSPTDIAFDKKGNLFITDFINNVIRKVDTAGIITTVVGTGVGAGSAGGGAYSGDNGPATAANLNGPFALALDTNDNIIFADGYNHVVRKVTRSTGIITTIAGKTTAGYSGDGGPATAAELNNPVGIAIDNAGNIYIADDHNNVIRKVNTSGIISTIAGNTTAGFSGDGGPATAAAMNLPIGIAFDANQNLFIADVRNNKIRKVNMTTGIITTVGGNDSAGYSGDGGQFSVAKLDSPQRINFDDSNYMYVSDFMNNVVRKVHPESGIITTIAGNGFGAGTTPAAGSFSGDGGPATSAGMYFPHGVAFDKRHNMYICDRGNDVIRKVTAPLPVNHTSVPLFSASHSGTLSVYPNPVITGVVTISLIAQATEPMEISVVNVLGETVLTTDGTTNVPVTLTVHQPTGVYVLSVTSKAGRWMKRVVVE